MGPAITRGTPVITPSKSTNGLPTSTPCSDKVSSRMVFSCLPLRFFTTDTAFFMAPRASKKRIRTTVSAR